MKIFYKIIPVFFVLLIVTVLISGKKREDEKKGIITYTEGQVKSKNPEMENWRDAFVNTEIFSGDKVRTYNRSRAEIDLVQLDVIRLAPQTIIDIVKLYEETKDRKIKTKIDVKQGEIWASIHEIEMDTEFDVSAPIAAAAITGTTLRFRVEADSTTILKVYKGEVLITNAPEKKDLKPRSLIPHEIPGPTEIPGPREVTKEEWLYIVQSMQQVKIDKNGKIISKGKFKADDVDEKTDWVKWNRMRDLQRNKKLR